MCFFSTFSVTLGKTAKKMLRSEFWYETLSCLDDLFQKKKERERER